MIRNDVNIKLEYYFAKRLKIHLSCSKNIFYNGFILDLNSNKDLLVFNDDKLGNIPILFEEIERIEPFKDEMEEEKK